MNTETLLHSLGELDKLAKRIEETSDRTLVAGATREWAATMAFHVGAIRRTLSIASPSTELDMPVKSTISN
ncbi:TPA: hypothetical protein DIV48_03510 [Candidatus Kaiserbacteria bacterium]|nr:MAG: hypothetical protein UY93_C0002G0338 [Parcubacteria group bacterium GW2011_GWA1_56_13]KKW46230.1 MAG: hypothetical protein UY97_C0008G0017 [Parcubacteria group bacterium GW2011_GWB1_57_6]HCR52680.1 hypothetical protein [Candidatus Kaiserbacteria bacterium]